MRNNRSIFFIIIGLALLITIGALLLEQFGIYTLPSRAVAKTPIQVAVPADLADWAKDAADSFNSRNGDAAVTIISVNGLPALNQFERTVVTELPHAWIPEASFVAAIAAEDGLAFESTGESIVTTDMSWGAFQSRSDALGSLDWTRVNEAAVAEHWSQSGGDGSWGFFKLTIASPSNSAEGLAALISACASYHQSDTLTRAQISDAGFTAWMDDIILSVPNFNTLGSDPAGALASRGASAGDVGFLSTASWNRSRAGLNKGEGFVLAPAKYSVELDYPYVLRTRLESDEAAIADRFGDYLKQQSNELVDRGFSVSSSASPVQIDGPAAQSLLRWAGR